MKTGPASWLTAETCHVQGPWYRDSTPRSIMHRLWLRMASPEQNCSAYIRDILASSIFIYIWSYCKKCSQSTKSILRIVSSVETNGLGRRAVETVEKQRPATHNRNLMYQAKAARHSPSSHLWQCSGGRASWSDVAPRHQSACGTRRTPCDLDIL